MPEQLATAPPLAEILRLAAAAWLKVRAGNSLDHAFDTALTSHTPDRVRAAVQATCYAAMRHRVLCERLIAQLAARAPDPSVDALLTVALAQLIESRHADYAVVDQSVRAMREQGASAATSGFVNAVLRTFLRRHDSLVADLMRDELVRFNAPRWWIDRVRAAHPAHADEILTTALQAPPLVLRVNTSRLSVADYQAQLAALGMDSTQVGLQAVWVHRPQPVSELPGFAGGLVSVQDAGAQLAAPWLDARSGQRVLDACAAPGGKTSHLAELAPLELNTFELTALEIDAVRAQRIADNLRSNRRPRKRPDRRRAGA